MEGNTILWFLTCQITVIVQVTEGNLNCYNSNFNLADDKFLNGKIFKTIQPLGRQQCVNECQKENGCKSVNFWRSMLKCQLNSDTETSGNQLVSGTEWSYVQVDKQLNPLNCSEREISVTLANGDTVCVVHRCDSVLVIDNQAYYVADTSIGAYTYQPCTTAPGYISLGCKYVCKSTGEWAETESNGTIKIYTTARSWYNANTTCASQNARLLVMPDLTYYNMVKGIVEPIVSGNQYQATCGLVTYQFWIGATDIQVEGTFKWLNGDGFSSWHTSILNADNDSCDNLTPVDCILIAMDLNTMHDRNCNALLPYICQKY